MRGDESGQRPFKMYRSSSACRSWCCSCCHSSKQSGWWPAFSKWRGWIVRCLIRRPFADCNIRWSSNSCVGASVGRSKWSWIAPGSSHSVMVIGRLASTVFRAAANCAKSISRCIPAPRTSGRLSLHLAETTTAQFCQICWSKSELLPEKRTVT